MCRVRDFAHYAGNTLNSASPIVWGMAQPLVQTVAENVRRAFAASNFPSERALADKADVAPNTLRAVMEPELRAPTKRGEVSLRLDVLEKIAIALGVDVWALMSEDFQPTDPPKRMLKKSEQEFYDKILKLYQELPKPDKTTGPARPSAEKPQASAGNKRRPPRDER